MYCRNCGNELLKNDNFCAYCGCNIGKGSIHNSLTNDTELSGNDIAVKSMLVQKRDENITEKRTKSEETKKDAGNELPMNWWTFWQYARFPLSIIAMAVNIIGYLPNLEVNTINIFIFLIDFLFFTFMCTTYCYFFMQNNKIGYNLINAYLIIESIYFPLVNSITIIENVDYAAMLMDFAIIFVALLTIWTLIWTLPNYIYFKKRKKCFDINK